MWVQCTIPFDTTNATKLINTTAMFLSMLIVVICFDLAYANSCPSAEEMGSCQCRKFSGRLEVRCENIEVDQLLDSLPNVANTEFPIELKLKGIELYNLPARLLVGMNLQYFTVEDCNLASLEYDAFSDVTDKLLWLFLRHGTLMLVPSQALEKLSALTDLDLGYNRLESLPAEAFKGLISLSNLWLTGNRIKLIDDSAFVGIGNELSVLFIDENQLTAVPSQQLRHLTKLKRLILNKNEISTPQAEEFKSMSGQSLIELNLANNNIYKLQEQTFESLKNLQNLYLSKNSIDYLHPSAFQGLEGSLMYLHLDNNLLTEIPVDTLQDLKGLRTIHLERNRISTVGKNDFWPYGKNLKYIFLDNNPLNFIDPDTFVCLNHLRYLYLQSNKLNSLPFETYAPVLDTLQKFNISDNPFHCGCELSWLSEWMKGEGSSVVSSPREVKCASPEWFADKPINSFIFVCQNETSSKSMQLKNEQEKKLEVEKICESKDSAASLNVCLPFVKTIIITLQMSLIYFSLQECRQI